MFIYSAQLQAQPGKGGDLAAQLPELAAKVSAAAGTPASAWAVATGAPIGSFAISARIENTAELLAMQQGLAGSEKYQKASAKLGGLLAGPAITNMLEVVMTAGEAGEAKPLTTVTRAALHGESLSASMAWSAQLLEYAAKTTGVSGFLATTAAGPMFQVAWLTGSDDAAELDETNAKLASDATYMSMLEQGTDHVIPGSVERMLLVRMS